MRILIKWENMLKKMISRSLIAEFMELIICILTAAAWVAN